MSEITVKLPHLFVERDYQRRLLKAFQDGKKRFIQRWHRRSGKDLTDLAGVIVPETQKRVGTYFTVFPTYNQGRKVLWDGMDKEGIRYTDRIPESLTHKKLESSMRVEFINGSAWQIVGSDRIDNLVGTNPIGAVFSEYSLQNPECWDLLKPIMRENGGWAMFNFTPRGKNHAYDLEQTAKKLPEEWHIDVLDVEQTNVLSVKDRNMEREECIAKNGDDAFYQQEWMVSYNAALVGAYYTMQCARAEKEGRFMREGLWEPTLPVFDVWDLGISDAMSIGFFQWHGNKLVCVDYEEETGKSVLEMIKVCQNKPYVYGKHFAPHDIRKRELMTGKTRIQIAKEAGWEFIPVPLAGVQNGIDLVRMHFHMLWFDSVLCKKLIRLIPQYTKKYDEMKRCFLNVPQHDWTSHGADMLRYAVAVKDQMRVDSMPDRRKSRRQAKTRTYYRKKY